MKKLDEDVMFIVKFSGQREWSETISCTAGFYQLNAD